MPDQSQDETARDERPASNHDLADQMAVAAAEALAPAVAVAAARIASNALARTAVGGTAICAAGIAAATALQTPAAKRAIVRIAKPLAKQAVESARSGKLNRAAHQAADNAKHAAEKPAPPLLASNTPCKPNRPNPAALHIPADALLRKTPKDEPQRLSPAFPLRSRRS